MATTSQTTYTHTCDLCGTVQDETALAKLFDGAGRGTTTVYQTSHLPRIDICQECEARPVSDVLAFFRRPAETEGSDDIRARLARLEGSSR